MSRWIAGIYDPLERLDRSRLERALDPEPARLEELGPLRLTHSGPRAESDDLLCLFDGHLDNATELLGVLGEGDDEPAPAPVASERLLKRAYRRWGPGLLERLRGDFALLIWDRERERGLLARDQLGARPLFVRERDGGLYFGSDVRHVLAMLDQRPAPDPAGVAHWVAASSRPGTQTLFGGIRRLAPAGMLLFDREGPRERRYWTPSYVEPTAVTEAEAATQVSAALERSVSRRVAVDGATGVLMSGGLDSAAVAAVSARVATGQVLAYSGVFPEHPAVDESPLIDSLRERLELAGATAQVRPGGLLASALESLERWKLPLLGWGDFWTLPLMRAARSAGAEVILGGDGGDEVFGARSYLISDRLRAGDPRDAVRLARSLPGAGDRPPRREVARVLASVGLLGALPRGPHELLRAPLARRATPAWLRPELARKLVDTDDPLAFKRLDGPRWWAHLAHGLSLGIEETGVFEHQRRRAALAGIEARHPLLDLDLIELSLRLPPRLSFDPHRNRPVLRASMSGLLPEPVRTRPGKAWFESLIIDSLNGPDGRSIRRLLTNPRAELGAYIDLRLMRRALFDSDRELSEAPFRWMWHVWRLVTAECWLQDQAGDLDGASLASLAATPARVDLGPV